MRWLLGLIGGVSGGPGLWIVAAVLLASLTAWGGLGWYGKASAERDLDAYQLAAARVITDRLEENQRLSDARAIAGASIDSAYQKGKTDAAKTARIAQDELARLRATLGYPAPGLRSSAAPDPRAVPAAADPARLPDAAACTDHPGAILDAADRVVEDLAACADEKARLASLQQWVREVCAH